MIYAKIIEDSISDAGKRITTFELNYPRIIHGEVMTHRVFSRNAMSSRAIPVAKMIEQVRTNPFIPHHWGVNQPGMQADGVLTDASTAEHLWLTAAHTAASFAEDLAALGLHKQVVNRLLEPFQWMRTILTSTEFNNFFALRDHKDAEPHFQILAQAMRDARAASTPVLRNANSLILTNDVPWHLPYILPVERVSLGVMKLCKMSAARCARVSYLTHEGKAPSVEADLALYDRLAGGVPIHASPLEHQALSQSDAKFKSGNFVGWLQYRQLVPGAC